MLRPSYLESVSDQIIELYSRLEYDIKMDMARRIKQLGKLTDATIKQAEILQSVSMLKNDINKLIKKYDAPTRRLILDVFNDAMREATKEDLYYASKAKRWMSESQKQRLEIALERFKDAGTINKTFAGMSSNFAKLQSNIIRMTLTVADTTQKQFLNACNTAYMQVSSGAMSWDSAYRSACKELSQSAIYTTFEDYTHSKGIVYSGSGRTIERSLESAVKMNILTGINQSASEQTLQNAETLGVDEFEVDAHLGARDKDNAERPWANHAEWQGQIFTKEELKTVCGLGEVDGLCGINCKHSFYPYFDGMTPEYEPDEIEQMNNETVEIDGVPYSRYEAEQKLRVCERNIRSYKNQTEFNSISLGAEDDETIHARNMLWKWQNKAQSICSETGIERQYINEYIGTKDGKQPRGLKPQEK